MSSPHACLQISCVLFPCRMCTFRKYQYQKPLPKFRLSISGSPGTLEESSRALAPALQMRSSFRFQGVHTKHHSLYRIVGWDSGNCAGEVLLSLATTSPPLRARQGSRRLQERRNRETTSFGLRRDAIQRSGSSGTRTRTTSSASTAIAGYSYCAATGEP